jgi:hypothetical protein
MDLAHVIVAMNGEKVAKVLCGTCGKEHVYRPPKGLGTSSKKKRTTKDPELKKAKSAAEDWEKAVEQCEGIPSKVYSIDGSFEEGDKLDHSTFGLGLVKKVFQSNRMEVIFKEGTKLLVWGGF